MKQLLPLFIVCLGFVVIHQQQVKAQEHAVHPENIMINPSLSFGVIGGYYTPYSAYAPTYGFAPNFNISAKFTFHKYISAGPFFGISWNNYNVTFANNDYEDRIVRTAFGAKGTFHYLNLLDEIISTTDLRSNEFDLYANLYVGARVQSVNYTEYDNQRQRIFKRKETDVDPIFRPNLGARWFASDFFGLFTEFGWSGMGYFKVGATFKFN